MLCFFFCFSFSWWGHAHSLITGIALDQFSAKEREILENTANFGQLPKSRLEESANWQDDLKGTFNLGIMSYWHFIQKPLIDYTFAGKVNNPTYNITTYLSSAWKTLLDPTTTDPGIIGFHLRSIVHFVGDVHTPHHNVAHYTNETPTGDSGGNLYILNCKHGSACNNIHFLWDAACFALPLGNAMLPVFAEEFSHNITSFQKNLPKSSFEDLNTIDFNKWSQESFDIVSEYGYTTPQNEEPSEQYLETCRILTTNRVAEAGYRLANMLRILLNNGLPGEYMDVTVREIIMWIVNCVLVILTSVFFALDKKRKQIV